MNKVTLKNCTFGDGIPKLCVPIVGRTDEDILLQAERIIHDIKKYAPLYGDVPGKTISVVEFRADFYDKISDEYSTLNILKQLREIFQNQLILFTYRSEDEGGELRHDRAENMIPDIYEWVIASGYVDMIDVELMAGEYRTSRFITKAHDKGILVVLSNHDFDATPRDSEIIKRFKEMDKIGGDILKIAAMPNTEFDVRRLMELTTKIFKGEQRDCEVSHPIVTMSMGMLGRISRISGNKTGSALTFVTVGGESAPGQLTFGDYLKIACR